jgi:hypothetical protein
MAAIPVAMTEISHFAYAQLSSLRLCSSRSPGQDSATRFLS